MSTVTEAQNCTNFSTTSEHLHKLWEFMQLTFVNLHFELCSDIFIFFINTKHALPPPNEINEYFWAFPTQGCSGKNLWIASNLVVTSPNMCEKNFYLTLFKFQALLVANVNNFANLLLSCLWLGLFSPNIGSGLSLFADCVQNSGFNG